MHEEILAAVWFSVAAVMCWVVWPLRKGGWLEGRELAGLAFILLLPSARRQLGKILEHRRAGHGRQPAVKLPAMTYTAEAQAVVTQAENESRDLGHSNIGVTHLLLALTAIESPAAVLLKSVGADHDTVKAAIVARHGVGSYGGTASRQLTYRASRALELAAQEHLELAAQEPEQILLGITGVPSSDGADILAKFIPLAQVREKLLAGTSSPAESPMARMARLASQTLQLETEVASLSGKLDEITARAENARKELLDVIAEILAEEQ